MEISSFTFNDFFENTYVVFDHTKECIIIDPGCSNESERTLLDNFIEERELTPVRLINTHCHIDHILGNHYIASKYDLKLEAHEGEKQLLRYQPAVAQMYAIPYEISPEIEVFLEEGETVDFGESSLEILFTPGHSPASVSLFDREGKNLIAGDVLFQGSIGRTDLPGGDYDTLINSIKTKLLPLGDDVKVLSGHGPATSIGQERLYNPFLTS